MGNHHPKDRDQLAREADARQAATDKFINRELKRAHAERLRRRSAREDWIGLMGLLLAVFVTGAFVARVIFQ